MASCRGRIPALPEARQRAAAYLDGLQHLLGRAVWSADAARDELFDHVAEHLEDPGGVVVVDETGFPKKGECSAGVGRQYCGTLGKVGNCQVGVFLAYAGPRGHTLLDRELYLPEGWTNEPARLQAVGLAPDTPFATKPQLAQRMLARVRAARVPMAWVTGGAAGTDLWRVDEVHAVHRDREWHRISAGTGSKGEHWYDWQCRVLAEPEDADWGHYLLFRRSCTDPDDWQAYVTFAPRDCDLETIVGVAGRRWHIESAFEAARQETGLDDYEVRSAEGWCRHVTLAMWALALLAIVRAADLERPHPQKKSPGTHGLTAFRRSRGLAGG